MFFSLKEKLLWASDRTARSLLHQQQILDEFSRELDLIEKRVPMRYSYERIEPCIVEKSIAGINFLFLIYHKESEAWFLNCDRDGVLSECRAGRLVKKGDVIFDLGCNSGFLTCWFAKAVGSRGQVHAFDPFPWNTAATSFSARLNGCKNVHVHTVGIARERKTIRIPFYDCKIYENSSVSDEMCFDATLRPLDEFLQFQPNLIKVDIEGAERELLAGAVELLKLRRKPTFVLEMHHDYIEAAGADPDEIFRQLAGIGYVCREFDSVNGTLRDGTTPSARSATFYAKHRSN